MTREVDSKLYSKSYYLDGCAGFEEYKTTGGQTLSPRHKYLLDIARIEPGSRLLDIGTGRGEIPIHAARSGAEAVGVDYAQAAVSLAEEMLKLVERETAGRVRFQQEDAQHMTFADDMFDVVTMFDVVEHLYPEQLENVLDEAYRVLKPAGRLIVHTDPNRNYNDYVVPLYWRWVRMVLYCPVKWLTGRRLKLSIRSDVEKSVHVNEQRPYELRRLLTKKGFITKLWASPFAGRCRELPLGECLTGMAMSLWPLNMLPGFKDFLNTHIFAVAVKPGLKGGCI
ncbi:MAG: class I SAM-dependent methyltransferase [Lentisphaerae bacterium]|nr:class I SAM-dependent methyltransferase [Lentisphaerota bacterium]